MYGIADVSSTFSLERPLTYPVQCMCKRTSLGSVDEETTLLCRTADPKRMIETLTPGCFPVAPSDCAALDGNCWLGPVSLPHNPAP